MSSKPFYQLKILNGVNVGATARLTESSPLVIGRSAACDLILNGADVADKHVKIEISNDRVRLLPLAQPVYVDDEDIGLHEITLRPYQIIGIGKVEFAVGDGSIAWSDVTKVPRVQKKSKSSSRDDQQSGGWDLKKILFWLTSIVLLIAANVHYFSRDAGGILGVLGVKAPVTAKVEKTVTDFDLPGIKVQKDKKGKQLITGYVDTRAQKQRLVNKIRRLDRTVRYKIWADTDIENNAGLIASTFKERNLKFTSDRGKLDVQGFVSTQESWDNVKQNIERDMDGITSINDANIKTFESQLKQLRNTKNQEAFAERLKLELNEGSILATGELIDQEMDVWNRIHTSFSRKNENLIPVVSKISNPRTNINLKIRSVSVGDVPFLVSKDGKKYFKGSTLADGYTVERIEVDRIIIKHKNIEIPIFFGKENNKSDAGH